MEQEDGEEGGLRLELRDWLQEVGGKAGGQSQVGECCLKTLFYNEVQSRGDFALL